MLNNKIYTVSKGNSSVKEFSSVVAHHKLRRQNQPERAEIYRNSVSAQSVVSGEGFL